MRRKGKVDRNQPEIVEAFRALGCSVRSTAGVGDGFPDIAVGIAGYTTLIEIKDGKKPPSARRLTPEEEDFKDEWRGSVLYIEDVADVPMIVNSFRNRHV